jgi:hypothetical protein
MVMVQECGSRGRVHGTGTSECLYIVTVRKYTTMYLGNSVRYLPFVRNPIAEIEIHRSVDLG